MTSVSVIIPSYNMAPTLSDAVQSVLRGQHERVEVIVIDDGSSDGTPNVCRQFTTVGGIHYDARVRVLRQENAGKAAALNLGFRSARGQYVTVLDADDLLTPESLTSRLAPFDQDERLDAVIGSFEVFDGSETLGVRPLKLSGAPSVLHRRFWLGHKTPFHMNACLVKREIIEAIGPIDTRLSRCQDIDFSMRMLASATKVACIEDVVYRYRKHRSSRRERLRLRFKTLHRRPLVFWKNCPPSVRIPAILAGVCMDLGKGAYELVSNYHN